MPKVKELINLGYKVPEWLREAKVQDEDVEFSSNDTVVWNKGVWRSGTWENGVWMNGLWMDGVWEGGVWKNGIWQGGVWKKGTWESGTWCKGVWECGLWMSGNWRKGTWLKGAQGVRTKYSNSMFLTYCGKKIVIGRKIKTREEWVEFFEHSDEEYEIPRNSPEFREIRAQFYGFCLYLSMSGK